jgi:hypothetical protein
MDSAVRFYQDLPSLHQFAAIAHAASFQPVPDDWVVVMTDVVESTRAIEAGRQKEVNIAGILGIIAQIHLYHTMEFPFAFGGDGATFLLPAALLPGVKDVLGETRTTCQERFGLTLRVGFMPVKEIYAAGHDLRVAKLQVSQGYHQAVLLGSGFEYAESLLKTAPANAAYLLPAAYAPQNPANYAGLVCPFQAIRGSKDETISLIIKVIAADAPAQQAILETLLQELDAILGPERSYHPLAENLRPTMATRAQTRQAITLHTGLTGGRRFYTTWLLHLFLTLFSNFQVRFFPKQALLRDADVRKFDGSLKMIIACSTEQRQRLQACLDHLHRAGRIFYGLHLSDAVIVTCMTQFETMNGVHFVDGAGGGYAFAARALKQQVSQAHTEGATARGADLRPAS